MNSFLSLSSMTNWLPSGVSRPNTLDGASRRADEEDGPRSMSLAKPLAVSPSARAVKAGRAGLDELGEPEADELALEYSTVGGSTPSLLRLASLVTLAAMPGSMAFMLCCRI